MPIPEIDLSKSEEKAFRQIVLGEPSFGQRPLTGWTGVLVAIAVVLGYGLLTYWLLLREPVPLCSTLLILLVGFMEFTRRREVQPRNELIRKLYRLLEERSPGTRAETEEAPPGH